MRTRIATVPLAALLLAAAAGSALSADPATRPRATEEAPAGASALVQATRLSGVETVVADGVARITLRGNGWLEARVVDEARDLPPRLWLDFPGVAAAAPPVTAVAAAGVERVRVAVNSHAPLVTRVVVDLASPLPYRVERTGEGGRDLMLVVGTTPESAVSAPASTPPTASHAAVPTLAPEAPVRDHITPAAEVSVTPSALAVSSADNAPAPTAATEMPTASPSPVPTPEPRPVRAPVDDLVPVPVPVPVATAAAARIVPATPSSLGALPSSQASASQPVSATSRETPQFSGHPVSLDFQGVDLRAVLRTFAEVSELNLVIDPEVKGSVDVSLRDVPWDQALDIILRANQLGYSTDGNVVRIAPLARLRQEEEEKRKLQEARALSGELQLTTRTLNYAKASEAVPLVQNLMSARGKATVDGRTNQVILLDLPEYLERADALLSVLDQAERQVEIEARIIVTRKTFARELGVLWGFSGAVTPELGNTPPIAFPNRGVLSGGVNLPRNPLPGSTGLLDLALGSVNGAFNLDAALRALETEGKIRTLLTPRIVTQNNVRATVTRGQEIPYTTTVPTVPEGSGAVQLIQPIPTVQFKSAALTLAVTPRITAAGTVVLEVDVDNGSPGQAEANGNRAINTQRAQTTVLVRDGATTVIGGIQGTTETAEHDSVPGLSKLPLIGRLFRNSIKGEEEEEILIFITPRIIEMQ